MRPVWLVAMSWFPTKNRASTGTPRWNTPTEGKEYSVRTPLHREEESWQQDSESQKIQLVIESLQGRGFQQELQGILKRTEIC